MLNKINAKAAKDTLEEKLKSDSKILKDISSFISFGAAISFGEPLTLAAGLALIVKTAGATISTGIEIINRVFDKETKTPVKPLSNFERFKIIFYVQCQRFYIESIKYSLENIIKESNDFGKVKIEKKDLKKYQDQIACQLASLEEAEVSFLFCVEPLSGEIPLFNAFGDWLKTTLNYYGLEHSHIKKIIETCEEDARKRFQVYLATPDDDLSKWIRNYLAITKTEKISADFLNDLKSIRNSLDNWTEERVELQNREKRAWEDYRSDLMQLPDSKETMFNESFGVRKVFLKPEATYQVVGVSGEAGNPIKTPDTGKLFGALLSTRISGEDLIILCGGPGSGKSTFCRILASELAQNDNIYPVFLRLRRLKEGADIAKHIEECLHKLGVITRLSDLRELPNLIIILDGFDELVMASRSRLRQFFNLLREEHSTGPLRRAKIIVSGRDTLFPNGEGLPTGSHVITLLPFDKLRVETWGKKWRTLHQSGPGHTFKPEVLISTKSDIANNKPPLHHLVSWPLTLHLVARVHTAGLLDIGGEQRHEVDKAYLYRSILAETASRQVDQADGLGRLDPNQMREFLRSLSWEMYSRSTDSMDPAEVIPLLAKYYPDTSEADMSELADVAVVNSPELTKGEETGFEFVHKSFSEYLVAEKVADCIERVTYMVPGYGSEELEWRMTDHEAATELAPVIGIRLLTEEVQEMLEPMLGNLKLFLKGKKADEIVKVEERFIGLKRIVERFEILLCELLQGVSLDIINKQTQNKRTVKNPLEGYANYGAGLLIVGTAAAREIQIHQQQDTQILLFNGNKFTGAFWQILCILSAGGININKPLANRLFKGMSVKRKVGDEEEIINDVSLPFKTGLLSIIDGFESLLSRSVVYSINEYREIRFRERISMMFLSIFGDKKMVEIIHRVSGGRNHRYYHHDYKNDRYHDSRYWGWEDYENRYRRHKYDLPTLLADSELIDMSFVKSSIEKSKFYRGLDEIEHRMFRSGDLTEFIRILYKWGHELVKNPNAPDDGNMGNYLIELAEVLSGSVNENGGLKRKIFKSARDFFENL